MTIDKTKLADIRRKAPVFIIGCQRSGTSFLYRTLSDILDIGFGRDNTFFLNYLNTKRLDGELNLKDLKMILSDFEKSPVFQKRFKNLSVNNEDFIKCLHGWNYKNIVRTIYAYWALEDGKSRWGGKTPDYTGYVKDLISVFPDVKIIHIVRDGRDVALSFFNLPWGPKDAYVAASYWKKRVGMGSAGKKIAGDNFLEITYESLLTQHENMFRKILTFLKFDSCNIDDSIKEFNRKIVPNIRKNNTSKWKHEMNSNDIGTFEQAAGDVLDSYGYEILNKDTPKYGVPYWSKVYHYSRNYIIKGVKGHLLRSFFKRAFHYKFFN